MLCRNIKQGKIKEQEERPKWSEPQTSGRLRSRQRKKQAQRGQDTFGISEEEHKLETAYESRCGSVTDRRNTTN